MSISGSEGLLPSRETLVWICILACVFNIILITGLATAGVLKSTERGDIKYTDTQTRPEGNITVSGGQDGRFAIEAPTDADAFYNAILRVQSGGPLINDWHPDNLQEFHYLPVTYFGFAALANFGYVWFKIWLFVLSVLATIIGTYLLLDVESDAADLKISPSRQVELALVSLGFAPMAANFKVGQVTPFAYLAVATGWWAFWKRLDGWGGVAVAIPALLKPYWAVSLVIFASQSRRRWLGVVGFVMTVVLANIFSVMTFGIDTTLRYYSVLVESVAAESNAGVPISEWSVEAIHPFWFAGPAAIALRLLSVVPFAWLWLRYARSGHRYDAVALYTLSIAVLFTMLSSTTLIDLGIGLVAFIILGAHLYSQGGWGFGILAVAFLLAQSHTYVMELLVGNGHPNLVGAVGPTPMLEFFQPGAYAVLLLYGLGVWWALDRPDTDSVTSTSWERG